jgi:Mrp family chromosome partitioning ATPase
MSGQGSVGKSLVSSLLAVALRREGYRVGVLDADIVGPSIPGMFFPDGALPGSSSVVAVPAVSRTGIKVMSISMLLEKEDELIIWREPLISQTIRQFWVDVCWGALDYLVVDLLPGTSDAARTVMQSLPLSGVVLVTSPQAQAGAVVRKAAQLAQSLPLPVLGLIENLSYLVCPKTGKRYNLFGSDHAQETAAELQVPCLGCLPIDPRMARLCNEGRIEDYPAENIMPVTQHLVEEVLMVCNGLDIEDERQFRRCTMQTVVGLFQSDEDAQSATDRLKEAGLTD